MHVTMYMYDVVKNCLRFVNSTSYCSFTELCTTVKGDAQTEPGPLNSDGWRLMNLYPDLAVESSGYIHTITFYAAKSGRAYVSFWRRTAEHTYMLQAKIRIEADSPGLTVSIVEY